MKGQFKVEKMRTMIAAAVVVNFSCDPINNTENMEAQTERMKAFEIHHMLLLI
jgi:hypothetical protein